MDLTGIEWEVSKLWSGPSGWLLRTRQQRKTQAVFTPRKNISYLDYASGRD